MEMHEDGHCRRAQVYGCTPARTVVLKDYDNLYRHTVKRDRDD